MTDRPHLTCATCGTGWTEDQLIDRGQGLECPGRHPFTPAPWRAALVSCGKAKLDHPAPARDLYTGGLFQASRRHAEANYDQWFILSAKHGLVHPDTVLEPYDLAMNSVPASSSKRPDRRDWARRTVGQLRDSGMPTSPIPVELDLYAGADYVQPILQHLQTVGVYWTRNITVHDVLRGFQIGQRLHWFAEHTLAS